MASVAEVKAGLAAGDAAMETANQAAAHAAEEAGKLSVAGVVDKLNEAAQTLQGFAEAADTVDFEGSNEKREEAGTHYTSVLTGAGNHPTVQELYAALNEGMGGALAEGIAAKMTYRERVAAAGAAITEIANLLNTEAEPQVTVMGDKAKDAGSHGATVVQKSNEYAAIL